MSVDLTAVGLNTFNWLPGAKRLVQFGEWPDVVPEAVVTAVRQSVAAYAAGVERGVEGGDGP